MPDRLLYQSKAEQLVPERGLDVVEPEVSFFVFLGTSGFQGRFTDTLKKNADDQNEQTIQTSLGIHCYFQL